MRVTFSSAARDDLRDAVEHYDSIDAHLSNAFLNAITAVVDRLSVFPLAATPVHDLPGVRRARVRRFPYGIFYVERDGELVVLRVLHSRADHLSAVD